MASSMIKTRWRWHLPRGHPQIHLWIIIVHFPWWGFEHVYITLMFSYVFMEILKKTRQSPFLGVLFTDKWYEWLQKTFGHEFLLAGGWGANAQGSTAQWSPGLNQDPASAVNFEGFSCWRKGSSARKIMIHSQKRADFGWRSWLRTVDNNW